VSTVAEGSRDANYTGGMIDIHSHILPDVDDGALDLGDALAIAAAAVAAGTSIMVATPHFSEESALNSALCRERLAGLRRAIAELGIGLDVRLGCEARFVPSVVARATTGDLPTLAGSSYLLLEWPISLVNYTDQILFDLRLKGFQPILAHVERYRFVQSDVNMLVPLVERGTLAQVTAGSLTGDYGPAARRAAEEIVERGLAHVIASDTHSVDTRPPDLRPAVERAASLIGREAARAMVVDVPRAIVENRAVEISPPRPQRRRPFWALWRRESGRGS
jgi:protein-tyrosine phosphatase